MTTDKPLPKGNFYRFDPVADLLLEKLHLSPLGFGLLSILVGTALYLSAAWISDTLWSQPGQVGLLQDWLPWLWLLFIAPVVLGYYLWSFQAIDHLIQELEKSDVLDIDEPESKVINRISINAYKPRWRILLALLSTSISSIAVFASRSQLQNSWTSSGFLPIFVVTIATFVVVYMGSMLVLNLIANIWILHCVLKRELARKEFKVHPLHPDRCGGLRPLSDYAMKTAYLAAVLGIMVGLIAYQFVTRGIDNRYWPVYLIIPLYILLSIACFFGPLIAAHRGMRRAKEDLLHKISRQFQADYSQIHGNLTGDAESLQKGAEKIKELQAFYTLTNDFPVWPFDVQTFRRFLLTTSAPILPLLIGILQKLVGALLKQWGIDLS